ncbi:Endolytic peptidoglycan transglycosylase RlpA [Thauera humireducens]|uniref:septal ring lytic transglycosylase RlpA family protein n=1 Tax=Thauera humireducens TaxID=1134435 RepID=UPI002467A1AA|nr:septal ring lytic transglycosylase RlpA family protein [Thauera humireducens]CAH1746597.1 Endolytic peptidoglycan transglycosylase RlpA [Thauera humireducens]
MKSDSAAVPPPPVARHAARAPSLAGLALVAAAAMLLSACGSAPKRSVDTVASKPSAPAATTARRGGGYYKDDGPDDVPPDNLDAIPDAEPRLEPLHRFANRPYNVFGQGYVPATELRPFRERGRASWYGRRFHGKPTSSGEPYDMYAMTAAHPTLPIPSYVRVTHAGSGRTVVVRVNDRGPFHKGRIIDLSYTAAHKLGYINAGSAEVEIEQILPDEVPMMAAAKPVPPLPGRTPVAVAETPAPASPTLAAVESRTLAPLEPAPQASPSLPAAAATADAEGDGLVPHIASASAGIFLQLGAFASRANAEGFRATVEREVAEHAERLELFADGERFRLHAGPYDTVDAARAAAERIGSTLQLKPFVIVR